MSKIYLVTYDFREPTEKQLEDFYGELKNSSAWWHFIEGTWLIRTNEDAKTIYARLKPYINVNVNLLVLDVGTDMAGWLPKKAWDWIQQHRGESVSLMKESSL